MSNMRIVARLEELRAEIRAERISYGEIAELESLAEHIEPGDVELLEWAGVPEFTDTDAERGEREMTATRNLTAARKVSKWEFCERHAPWFRGETRYRIAETFVEGGPATDEPGCASGCCRLWPGRDFYVEEICHGEMDLEWTR